MASRTSTRRTAADRREQLLDIAARQLSDRGFPGTSMESVATEAGVTRATVYLHFRDLQDLLATVIERETSRAGAQLAETALTRLDQGDPQELMLNALDAYLHAVRSAPTTWRLVLLPPDSAPPALREKIAAGRETARRRLSSAVRPLADREPGMPDAELTARILSAVSDEYARLVLTDPVRHPIERLVAHARWWLEGGASGG